MAVSPLPAEAGLPGRPVLGFLACGAVVRKTAYLEVGGFSDFLFFIGEEGLLARMGEVVARLSADLPLGTWGCNSHDGREWVVAHASIDLAAIVDDVLAP